MKVVGFSFIRNAIKFQYPIEEALRSILPLCDEIVVAVGASDDGTRELVASIDPRIRVIDTVWDDSQKKGGRVLALETDMALQAIPSDADWCVYIQGDEVLHEDGHDAIRKAMQQWKDDKKGAFMLMFDDSLPSHVKHVIPALAEKGIAAQKAYVKSTLGALPAADVIDLERIVLSWREKAREAEEAFRAKS